MQLPRDLRAHALRTTIDAALTALRSSSGDKHVAQLLDDAPRHALDLELSLRPHAPSTPPRPGRRFEGHPEPGSNVVVLRAV